MNLESWAQVATIVVLLTTLIGFFWKSLNNKFNKIDEKFKEVKDELKEIKKDIGDIKERLAFVEAETIIYNTIPHETTRSEAAKKMWARRKAKQLEKK